MFLLGSYTSPMPKVRDVTEAILNGNYHFHSNGKIYSKSGFSGVRDVRSADFVKAFLRLIVATIRENSSRKTAYINYEDFKYVIEQLAAFEGTGRNPAIRPFRNLLHSRALLLLASNKEFSAINSGFIEADITFGDILATAQHWTEWVIYEQLLDRDNSSSSAKSVGKLWLRQVSKLMQ